VSMLLIAWGFGGFLLASPARAATLPLATLSDLQRGQVGWTLSATWQELIPSAVAVKRGNLTPSRARQYKALVVQRNKAAVKLAVSPKVRISLLTNPNFKPQPASLEQLRQLLSGSEDLPLQYEVTTLFALSLTGQTVTAITAVDQRVVTGVYTQAVYIDRRSALSKFEFTLDFVTLCTTDREMRRVGQTMEGNPGGLYIANTNALLRRFTLASDASLSLLNGVTPYRVTLRQLEAALRGGSGSGVSWNSYFLATISDLTGEVFEFSQGYTP
jgi:hypothetical protein